MCPLSSCMSRLHRTTGGNQQGRAFVTLACTGLLLACGCAGPLNNELSTGDPLTPSNQFQPPSVVGPQVPARSETDASEDAPVDRSVTSLDRSHWGTTRVLVPNEMPMHQPRYTSNWEFDRSNARSRGEHPSATSAIDMPTSKGADLQLKEAALAPIAAGADIALMPARMIAARPWQRTRTGSEPYQRVPQSRVIVPDGLTPVDDDAPAIGPADVPPREMMAPLREPGELREPPRAKSTTPLPGQSLPWPSNPNAAAPTSTPRPAPPRPSAQPLPENADEPLWNRPPVATDERGKQPGFVPGKKKPEPEEPQTQPEQKPK